MKLTILALLTSCLLFASEHNAKPEESKTPTRLLTDPIYKNQDYSIYKKEFDKFPIPTKDMIGNVNQKEMGLTMHYECYDVTNPKLPLQVALKLPSGTNYHQESEALHFNTEYHFAGSDWQEGAEVFMRMEKVIIGALYKQNKNGGLPQTSEPTYGWDTSLHIKIPNAPIGQTEMYCR